MTIVPTEDWRPTEWYDDGEPPDQGIRIDSEDLGTPWSHIHAGTRIRFKTQTTLRRGTVTSVKNRSMRVQFDGMSTETVIPDAKWYFVQARMGNMNEHLVCIATPAPAESTKQKRRAAPTGETVTPAMAANILGTDPKNIRRMIRNGKLDAWRDGGRWLLSRDAVEALL